MNDQTQQQLAEYLKQFVEAVKAGSEFALEQAPLVVQEKILHGRIVFTIPIVVLAVCLPLWLLFYVLWRDGHDWAEPPTFLAGIGTIAGSLAVLFTVDLFVKVWFAPRLYIVEWAAQLIK